MVLCVEDIVPSEIPEMFIECGMSVARSFLTTFLVTRETSEPESRKNWPLYSDKSEQISARLVAEISLDDRVSRWMALLLAKSVEAVETTPSCRKEWWERPQVLQCPLLLHCATECPGARQ